MSVFTGAYPPGRGPESWASCGGCGQHDYSHAPGCEERPVLRGGDLGEWRVCVRGVEVGRVRRVSTTMQGTHYVATGPAGSRLPSGRPDQRIWRRGHAVNAVVRAWRERQATPELVELDAPTDSV